jgi:hypothetical protein
LPLVRCSEIAPSEDRVFGIKGPDLFFEKIELGMAGDCGQFVRVRESGQYVQRGSANATRRAQYGNAAILARQLTPLPPNAYSAESLHPSQNIPATQLNGRILGR